MNDEAIVLYGLLSFNILALEAKDGANLIASFEESNICLFGSVVKAAGLHDEEERCPKNIEFHHFPLGREGQNLLRAL